MKSELEKQYDDLITHIVWPLLKIRGYKKAKGRKCFEYHNSDAGFKKEVWFSKEKWTEGKVSNTNFTEGDITFHFAFLNYLADYEFHTQLQEEENEDIRCIYSAHQCDIRYSHLYNEGGIEAVEQFYYSDDPYLYGGVYYLRPDTNIQEIQKKVESDFIDIYLPYLDKIKTKEDMIEVMVEHAREHCGVIRTLYYNGQKKRALSLLHALSIFKKENRLYRLNVEIQEFNELEAELMRLENSISYNIVSTQP